jgi:iron complex outermembrane receptor protein
MDVSLQDFARLAIGNIIFNTAPYPQGALLEKSVSWSNVSPRFVVDYHWSKDLMTYASASFGYKAGGFNSVALNSEFEPEKVQNYEIGMKSSWLDHHVQLNGSAYYYDYTNQQSLSEVTVAGSALPQYVTSTGDSYAKGVDLELAVVPVTDLKLGVVTGYIDSTWNKRMQGEQTVLGATQYIDLHGQPTGEPSIRAVFTLDYRYRLGDLGQARFHIDHSFTSAERQNSATRFEDGQLSQLVDLSTIPGYHQARNLTNLRLGWSDPDDHWDVSFYAQNLFDNHYVSDPGGLAVFLLQSPMVRPQDPPRFIGGEAIYRF